MTTSFVDFAGLRLRLCAGWLDITGDLDPGAPPTLARADGVGALQATVAVYAGGEDPAITRTGLLKLLREFGVAHALGQPKGVVGETREGRILLSGRFSSSAEVIVAWYLTNGHDLALVTYTSLEPNTEQTRKEIVEAEAMLRSATL